MLLNPSLAPAAWAVLPPRGTGDPVRSRWHQTNALSRAGPRHGSCFPRFYGSPLGARSRARGQTARGSPGSPTRVRSPAHEQAPEDEPEKAKLGTSLALGRLSAAEVTLVTAS